jgi:hypothetical protein
MHNPLARWSLIIFLILLFTAPLLAADILGAVIAGIQGAIDSLKIFGDAVVPK